MAHGSQSAVTDPDQGELAQVIDLHPPRSCFTCFNSRIREDDLAGPVTWCSVYDELIDSELFAAQDCTYYERCNDGDQPVEE